MIVDEVRSPIRSAIRSPRGPSSGTTFALDATAAAIRAAILDPASYASGGWRLPGLAGARLNASARSSVAMQQTVAGEWEFAPHNLLTDSETAAGYQSPNVVDNGIVAVAPPPGVPASAQVRSITPAGGGSAWRMGSLVGGTVGMNYAGGLWVRTVSGSVDLVLDVCDGGEVGFTATPAWQFVSTSRTNTPDTWRFLDLSKQTAGAATIYVCAPRLCLGSSASTYIPTTTTAVYGPAIDWLSGIGVYGLRSEEARTNSIRNSACLGAVSGSPGTHPTNWSFDSAGMARTITANITLLGMPAVDIRFSGTSSTGYVTVYPDDYVGGAAVSKAWAFSAFAALSAGSIGSALVTPYMADYSGAAFLRQRTLAAGAALPAGGARFGGSGTTGVSTDGVRGFLVVEGLSTVSASDFTIRIACPQLEQGAFASSPILTFGSAATRAADMVGFTDAGWLSPTAGTFIGDAVRNAASTGNFPIVIRLSGTAGNRMNLGYLTATAAGFEVVNGGVDQASMYPLTTADTRRVAAVYAANDFAACVNGGSVSTDAAGSPPTITSAWIGSAGDGEAIGQMNGHATRLRYATRRFSNAELQGVTA